MSEPKKKRKVIRSEGREIIAKVFHYLQEEYRFMKANNIDNCDLSPLANVTKRTAEATGVSERTVAKILQEERESLSKSTEVATPNKKQKKTEEQPVSDITHVGIIVPKVENIKEEELSDADSE